MRACLCVCSTATISFFILKCLSSPLAHAIFLPICCCSICLSIPHFISYAFPSPVFFSLSLSRSSSHSLCVARVMSARNLPRKLAYKNVDGKYLRSSSNSRGSSSNSNSTGNNNNKRSIEQQQQHPTLFDSLYEFG